MAKKKKPVRRAKPAAKGRTSKPAAKQTLPSAATQPVLAVVPVQGAREAWFVRRGSALAGMIVAPFLCQVVADRGHDCLLVAMDAGIGRQRQEVMVPPSEIERLERDDRRKVLETLPPGILNLLAGEYLLPTADGSLVDSILDFEFGVA